VRISFYAPLKAPTHPVPSGDRRMARLLMTTLELAGHKVALASDFRSYEGTGDPTLQEGMFAAGRVEAHHIIETCLLQPEQNRPSVWFTYHQYYKAPDHLGPAVSDALGIPYVVAEPSHAPKRANGPWKLAHESVEASLKKADCAFCLTRHDMACVEPVLASPDRLVYLPPFLDATSFQYDRSDKTDARNFLNQSFGATADVLLVAVGMMRKGDKYHSYEQLAKSLELISVSTSWQLVIVGDGEYAAETKNLFQSRNKLKNHVIFAGEQPGPEVARILIAADICVWPAVGEAYGMAMLEAQAAGLPVVAGDSRGVPDVVRGGTTATLVPPDNPEAFASAVSKLIDDRDMRTDMGTAAGEFVANERSLQQAAATLNRGLEMAKSNKEHAK